MDIALTFLDSPSKFLDFPLLLQQISTNDMKKISSEEFDQRPTTGRGKPSKVYMALLKMEVGEALLIEPEDWQRKYPATQIARAIEKKYARKFEGGKDALTGGWAFKREA